MWEQWTAAEIYNYFTIRRARVCSHQDITTKRDAGFPVWNCYIILVEISEYPMSWCRSRRNKALSYRTFTCSWRNRFRTFELLKTLWYLALTFSLGRFAFNWADWFRTVHDRGFSDIAQETSNALWFNDSHLENIVTRLADRRRIGRLPGRRPSYLLRDSIHMFVDLRGRLIPLCPSETAMTSRQHSSMTRKLHHARQDHSIKGPQSLAPNVEALRHYILTTGLPSTEDKRVLFLIYRSLLTE